MKIDSIVVQVTFEDENTDVLARSVCVIDASDIHRVRPTVVTDACQRAVAHCIDELQKQLDNSQ